VVGTREHWRGFYDKPRPCLADLVALGRTEEIDALYVSHDHAGEDRLAHPGRRAENWCVMPRIGSRLYLAIDAGPIYDEPRQGGRRGRNPARHDGAEKAQVELERLATRDGLTSVANRRSFRRQPEQSSGAAPRANRVPSPCS
jgi:hypothetical protein